jgi:hypothetical protein
MWDAMIDGYYEFNDEELLQPSDKLVDDDDVNEEEDYADEEED